MSKLIKPRRCAVIFTSGVFIIVCLYLYSMLEYAGLNDAVDDDAAVRSSELKWVKERLSDIERSMKSNHDVVNQIKQLVKDLAERGGDHVDWKQMHSIISRSSAAAIHSILKPTNVSQITSEGGEEVVLSTDACNLAQDVPVNADVQMLNVFDSLPFDNPDGGVWKQGYPITYDDNSWNSRKLKVFVIPHSHNDPGWIKTFEQYYDQQTRNIFNLMVEKLEMYPQMRFIYAEMSFFSMWWNQNDYNMRRRVQKLLNESRLEIVTGGWVMTDEANAHYFAMIDEMLEGNQWLLHEVGVKPISGWAIDPFGHSPTMAYLLKVAGFKNMLIQRIHYSVKKYLARNQQLEFIWRQNWDHHGQTDMFCHMMPFYSYDVPHTCGPDPAICCQFDFKRLPGGRISCPWKVSPVEIVDHNVHDRAAMLLDQYRKKSRLYKNEVLLVPLGDDFRYDLAAEWDNQYNNYQRLFDYMNSQSGWNVEVKFGTLSDYFRALRERANLGQPVGHENSQLPRGYPVLSGDFFTYADRDDHYWSGYYTSRPFYKQLDRSLEAYLRAGEIIFSFARSYALSNKIAAFPYAQLMNRLVNSRRNLGLFQHHDGITGTARDFVVVDYGTKMIEAINNMKYVIATAAHLLLNADTSKYTHSEMGSTFVIDEKHDSHDSLPQKTILKLNSVTGSRIIFYNSLSRNRTRVARILVDSPHVQVEDPDGRVVASQIEPFIVDDNVASDTYKLVFLVTVPAFGLARYSVARTESKANPSNVFASLTLYGTSSADFTTGAELFQTEHRTSAGSSDVFSIENRHMIATFNSADGMLQSVTLKDSKSTVAMKTQFVRYGVRAGKERSGAYLFLPDGEAQPIGFDSPVAIRVVRGPIASEVHVSFPVVKHCIRLTNSPGVDGLGLEVLNLVDIRQQSNYELAMRLQTDVKNSDGEFFTDLNGFQVQRRKTYTKLPLQANVYPMPAMAYIQDSDTRVNILTAQSLGFSSLQQGWLEVMQDRRLDQDDNRGLQQPVHDNKLTPNRFRILIEKRNKQEKILPSQASGFLSLRAHFSSTDLVHPVYVLHQSHDEPANVNQYLRIFHPLSTALPCDLHVVNMRSMTRGSSTEAQSREPSAVAVILHRLAADCQFSMPQSAALCQTNSKKLTLSSLRAVTARKTSLTLLEDHGKQDVDEPIDVPPMELYTYLVTLR